ncbi:MAG: MraY family glycosyltransferase [Planctomycetia bacterium]|nr:MraY family glycosyltransferase [Planctomycetia bacterium]
MTRWQALALVLGAILPSALISWAFALVVRRKAADWGWLDQPGHRKVHTSPVPLGGGVAIWLGVVGTFAVGQLALWAARQWGPPQALLEFGGFAAIWELAAPHLNGLAQQSWRLWLLLGAGTVLMALGLLDDRKQLDWRIRILVELVVATFIVWHGWRLTLFLDWPAFTFVLSVLWIVGLINSFNFLDNMDGLSGGVAAIAASILAAVLLVAPDPRTNQPQLFIAGFLLVLIGALLGFLLHNRSPARIFMGDAGAYFIGFSIATATIMATFAVRDKPHAILAPLCVLAVPIYDTLTVIAIRLRAGKSPFEGDKNHFSHRLVDLGMTKPQAVLTIYLTTATCGLGAFLLHQVNAAGAVIVVLLIACVLAIIAILEITARHQRKGK